MHERWVDLVYGNGSRSAGAERKRSDGGKAKRRSSGSRAKKAAHSWKVVRATRSKGVVVKREEVCEACGVVRVARRGRREGWSYIYKRDGEVVARGTARRPPCVRDR